MKPRLSGSFFYVLMYSSFPRQPAYILFAFTAAGVKRRLAVAKSLPVLQHSGAFIFMFLEIIEPILVSGRNYKAAICKVSMKSRHRLSFLYVLFISKGNLYRFDEQYFHLNLLISVLLNWYRSTFVSKVRRVKSF